MPDSGRSVAGSQTKYDLYGSVPAPMIHLRTHGDATHGESGVDLNATECTEGTEVTEAIRVEGGRAWLQPGKDGLPRCFPLRGVGGAVADKLFQFRQPAARRGTAVTMSQMRTAAPPGFSASRLQWKYYSLWWFRWFGYVRHGNLVPILYSGLVYRKRTGFVFFVGRSGGLPHAEGVGHANSRGSGASDLILKNYGNEGADQ